MNVRLHEVTITSSADRIVRFITATSTVQAMITALRTLPEQTVVLGITCKPLCSLIDEEEPCLP